jgi:hypothetical protein
VLCDCGEDADFRADGLPVDDGENEPEGQPVLLPDVLRVVAGPEDENGDTPWWLQ